MSRACGTGSRFLFVDVRVRPSTFVCAVAVFVIATVFSQNAVPLSFQHSECLTIVPMAETGEVKLIKGIPNRAEEYIVTGTILIATGWIAYLAFRWITK